MKFLGVFAVISVSVVGVFAQTAPGTNTPALTLSFGLVGVAAGQTARLNVMNSIRTAPPVLIPQAPCSVELSFYDGSNKLLKQTSVSNLAYGNAASLEMQRAEVTDIPASNVASLSAVVRVGSGTPTPSLTLFCSVVANVEIVDDSTKRTAVILGSPARTVSTTTPTPLKNPGN